MDDPMMEDSMIQDSQAEGPEPEDPEKENSGEGDPDEGDPEKGDPETEDPEAGDPETEEPETEDPDISLDEIVRRFGLLYALTDEEAEQERELCAAALGRVEEERNHLPGGQSPLMDYAAALAGRRYVLRCLARGVTVAIGDPRSGPAGARSAAQALEEDYRASASRWLRPNGLCFRQTAGAGRCRWTR